MSYPDFFHQAPTILVHDALAELLGACDGGQIEYAYPDAVKLAGHSCPTVAGAYLMTRAALRALYPDALPERGQIRVALRERQDAGVAGVIANVAGLITGAAQEGGFKGIGGRFDRRNLLSFGAAIEGEIEFARADGQGRARLSYHPEVVPPDAHMKDLMPFIVAGLAVPAQREEFAHLWQERVRRILMEHADDPELIVLGG